MALFEGAEVVVRRSAIYGNKCFYLGAGIATYNSAILEVYGSTIDGNTVADVADGQQVHVAYDTSANSVNPKTTARFVSTTVVNPPGASAANGSNTTAIQGSAIRVEGTVEFEMYNYIVAAPASVALAVNPEGKPWPLITLQAGVVAQGLLDTDPLQLGPLQDNGGPTLSRMPGFGSRAIDAGNNSLLFGQAVDQRGINRIICGTTDAGAVEGGWRAGRPPCLAPARSGRALGP
jgi:hypothetical protein